MARFITLRQMIAMTGCAFGMLALPASAGEPQSGVLSRIEPGRWELRDTDNSATRALCVRDARMLLQLGHPGARQCARFVISESEKELTVHYSCPGAGHGRTTIGIVTARSINLDTQGLANGLPFQNRYAARRLGACR